MHQSVNPKLTKAKHLGSVWNALRSSLIFDVATVVGAGCKMGTVTETVVWH